MHYLKLLLIPLVVVACMEPLALDDGPVAEGETEVVAAQPGVTGCPTGVNVPMCPATGEGNPPVVTIYDLNLVEIDALTVDAGESFTLVGFAVGDIPLSYFWVQTSDGATVVVAESQYLIDYVISEPGEYVITLVVQDANGLEGSDSILLTVLSPEPSVLDVLIDIKPGSDPNSINLGSNGVIPVAILSTGDFDATTVDPASVRLADAAVKVRGNGSVMASFEDVDGNGLLDLVVHIPTQSITDQPWNDVLFLHGVTFDGQMIQGYDYVELIF